MKKQRKISQKERMFRLYVRQLTTSQKLLDQLFKIYRSGLERNYDVVGVSYLIDLLLLQLMPLYGGDSKTIADLKNNVQNEMVTFNASPPIKNAIDELKKAGIDFSVLYDRKKKEVVPSIDVEKLRMSDEDMKKWMTLNFDRIHELMKGIEKNG